MVRSSAPRRLVDIGAEGALLAGGGRAVLLQLAHPAIGAAIADHSDFASRPTHRLEQTLTFVYALVYGTDDQAAAVTRLVNGRHAGVVSAPDSSTADGAGSGASVRYDANDPHLQLWVAATLYDTAVLVHDRLIGRLDDTERDAIYADYAIVGTALRVPAGFWPADRAAFADYWQRVSSGLSVDDRVREVAHTLLHPPTGPLWLRLGMPLARLVTAGLLDDHLRREFALPWSERRRRRFDVAMRVLGALQRVLPRRVREWPRDLLLSRLDRTARGGAH
ncbi:oxygenase MpaB family protein [Marisediminicola sp. LYQ134]|uniref:oxygenase MpaB family protein n=1 Tax=unclassified Marisediminicola TaxID=2618316 RepID=UPI0039833BFE